MCHFIKETLCICLTLCITTSLFAEDTPKQNKSLPQPDAATQNTAFAEETKPVKEEKKSSDRSFWNIINAPVYASPIERDDKKAIRQRWQELLGTDIFYAYFKAKEAEDWVKEKASIQIFNVKGKPEFRKDEVKYIFKVKF